MPAESSFFMASFKVPPLALPELLSAGLASKVRVSGAFFFIIGADSFYQFSNWVKPEKICKYAEILVAGRPEENTEYDFKEKKKA